MKAFLRFFSSVKLAIVLIILLVAVSILGTLIPQGREAAEYAARYGRAAELMVRLQLTNVYHSVWFLGLLGLFGLNIVACTVTRLGAKARRMWRPKVESDPKALAAGKIKDKIRLNLGVAEARTVAADALRAAHYRVRVAEDGSGSDGSEERRGGRVDEEGRGGESKGGGRYGGSRSYLLGRKRMDGIFGSDAVHFGLLVIIVGGIVTALTGFRTDIVLHSGETQDVPKAGYALRLDKFETETYPDGNVKDWKSTLTVIENGRDARTQVVEVNHPLVHRGFSFYQSAYGIDWDAATLVFRIEKKDDARAGLTVKARVGQKTAAGDANGTELLVRQFLPDFVLGENSVPESRSDRPDNPAAFVEGWAGGAKVYSGWVFAAYPDYTRMHGAAASDLTIELKDFDAPQYSVLQAAKDPGVPLIWLGCLLVMAGLFLAFYRPTWEIRMVLDGMAGAEAGRSTEAGAGASVGAYAGSKTGANTSVSKDRLAGSNTGKTEITAGGTATKSRERFEAEFAGIMAALRKSK